MGIGGRLYAQLPHTQGKEHRPSGPIPRCKKRWWRPAGPRWPRPPLAHGETLTQLLADRSAYEDFDPDVAGRREVNIEHLDQLALDHIFGVR